MPRTPRPTYLNRWLRRTLATLLLAAVWTAPALALEKATIQLKWLHHFQFAGYYAALAQGFYREAGLDVTIREGGPDVEVEREVAAGRADFGVGTSAILLDRARGNDLVVLAQIFQHSPAVFLIPRATGIHTVADMAGKRFMYSNQHGDMLALLKKFQVDEGQIRKVPHKGDARDLIAGKADVMIAYNFNEPFVMEQAGEPYLTFSPLTSGIDFYGDNLFTTRTLAQERPEFVKAFREATLRGWRYALGQKEKTADLILARYSRGKSREWLLFEASQMENLIQPDLVELGYQSPARWQRIADTFIDLGMLPAGFDATAVIHTPPQPANHTLAFVVTLISACIIAALVWLTLTFRRLNLRLQAQIAERTAAERERDLSELALRESERFLMESQQVGRIGSYVYDLAADRWSSTPTLDEIFGIDGNHVRDTRGWLELVDEEQREQMADYLTHAVINARHPFDREYRIRRPSDGAVRWVHGYGKLQFDGEGLPVRIIGTIQDVTERRKMEEERLTLEYQLLNSRRLESLGVLAGGIAHDFNNILTGIMGYISCAADQLEGAPRAAELLGEAEKATRRAADLARRLLTFAKGEQPVKRVVATAPLLQEACTLALSGSNVRCDLRLPQDLPPLEVDVGQIGQAFNNILINAQQAMPGGGTVTVSAENLELPPTALLPLPAGRYVLLRFSDQGCGIGEEDQRRIFDPYFTTKAGGTGLGLASVYSIVSKHDGHIAVCSRPGAGATFEVYLPASDLPLPPATEPVTPRSSGRAGASLLVMDDEPMIRGLARDMLENLGYRVQTCADGREAVQLYEHACGGGTPYAAVIVDLTIPGGMGGHEAARLILEADPDARLIVSSGYSDDPVMARYSDHGFSGCIPKPYSLGQMAAVLESVIP